MLLVFKTPDRLNFAYPQLPHDPTYIYTDNKAANIRTMSLAELIVTREKNLVPEGWNSIKYTMQATYTADPQGFYLLQQNLEDIASISVVNYPNNELGYIGFYHVIPKMRQQGYGKLLINQAMDYAREMRGVRRFGLNCVASAVPMYQNYGFTQDTSDEFWKYTVPVVREVNDANVQTETLEPALFTELVAYDTKILGELRQDFLHEFISKPATVIVLSIINEQIKGFGIMSVRDPAVMEPAVSYKIGPLYADNAQMATDILQTLVTQAEAGCSVYLDTPGNNMFAARMAEVLGFSKIGSQAKLYAGSAPDFVSARIFGYGSIAIGG